MKYKIQIARIIGGSLEPYLKDMDIIGRVQKEREQFYIFGCKKEDEEKFYKGILEYDKSDPVHGFETAKEVEEFWLNGCDGMFLSVEMGEYEIIREID